MSNNTSQSMGQTAKMAFDWVLRVTFTVLTILVGVIAWQGKQVITHSEENRQAILGLDRRVTAIESNRYTSQDAVQDNRAVQAELRALREWIENNYPPEWLLEDVKEIKDELRSIREKLNRSS